MKPIKFREANTLFAKDQNQYQPLPAYVDEEGKTISQWQLSIKERIKILYTGKLWLTVLTFKKLLQPQLPSVDCPFEGDIKPEDLK